MASIRKISENSYKITVSCGRTAGNKQIRHYMTWTPDKPMTEKQMEKAAQKAAFDFENRINLGFRPDDGQTFTEYAEYFMQLKQRDGLSATTLSSYRWLLKRLNTEFGHMKLRDIRPQHLNEFYVKLSKPGERQETVRCKPLIEFRPLIEKAGGARRFDHEFHVNGKDTAAVCRGEEISEKMARRICEHTGVDFKKSFKVSRKKTTLTNATIAHFHGLMSTILGQAEREMIVPYNAAEKATPPKRENKERQCLQESNVKAVLEALENEPIRTKAIVYTLLSTGCRCGELCAIHWEKIDFEKKRLLIDAGIIYTKETGTIEKCTKTKNVRYVALPDELISILRQYRNWYNLERFRLCGAWEDNGYVFCRSLGAAMPPSYINRLLHDVFKRHGIQGFTPHQFRHTYASLMIAHGVDIVTVSKTLGHKSTKTTLDIYSHEIETAKESAANTMNDVLKSCKIG